MDKLVLRPQLCIIGNLRLHVRHSAIAQAVGLTSDCMCRLRVSLSAAHTAEDIDQLAAAIKACNPHFLPIDQVLSWPAARAVPGNLVSKI